MRSASGLKNCYHLCMAALMADSPRYKLATQAGLFALAAAISADDAGSVGSPIAPTMADDGYHTHGIQLALCRAYAHLAMEHKPLTSRSTKRWAKAERHCLASRELKPKYEEGWLGVGRSQLEQGPARWDDAQATLTTFLGVAVGDSGEREGSLVGVARELLADLAGRRSQLQSGAAGRVEL
jgi:hypothetical protein